MSRSAAGDDAAFAELYDLLAPRLYRFILRLTRERPAAEDLLQLTMLRMHRGRGQFVPGAAVTPWSFAIARRLFIDEHRRDRREGAAILREDPATSENRPSVEPCAEDVLHARRLAEALEHTLSTLPESQRTAYELLKEDGLSLAEAAEVLGTTVTAVKLRAHRAYEALRAVLRDDAPPPPSL
jgi:RNA polymerase sigma-70 factor (ECF subfamily)